MNAMLHKKSCFLLSVFVLLCGVAVYCLVDWTPMICDDYQFQYKLALQEDGTYNHAGVRWESFEDFWFAFTHHGDWQNARFGNYAFLLTVYLGGIELSSVLNALVIVALWLFLTIRMFGRLTWTGFSFVFIAALLLLSAPDRIFLWHDGCSNYAWGCLILMVWLTVFESQHSRRLFPLCLVSFLCGAWHEGLAIPLFAALAVYVGVSFLRKRQIDYPKYLLAFVFVVLGFLWLFTSSNFVAHRASGGVRNCYKMMILAGGVYRMLLFCFPTLVAFLLLLYAYRKKIFDDFLFLFACMNVGAATLVFARGGGWGGGPFYCSFVVLLCALRATAPYLQERSRFVACPMVALVIAGLILSLIRVHEIRRVYDDIMEREIQNYVLRCDYLNDSIEVPWILKSAFYFMEETLDYAGRYFGKPKFSVVFNQKVADERLYRLFDPYPEDEAIWIKTENLSLVRLPSKYRPVYKQFAKGKPNTASGDEKSLILHSSLMSEWLSRTAMTLMRTPYVIEYYSYHQGHHYIVLPAEVNKMNVLEIEMSRGGKEEWIKVSPKEPLPM